MNKDKTRKFFYFTRMMHISWQKEDYIYNVDYK